MGNGSAVGGMRADDSPVGDDCVRVEASALLTPLVHAYRTGMNGTQRSPGGLPRRLLALVSALISACTPDVAEYSKPFTPDTATSAAVTDTASPTDDSATEDSTPTDTATTAPPVCTPPAPIAVDPDPACPAGTAALLNGLGYPTVADAVAIAVDGDRVEVCPGLWPANVVIGEGVTLSGRAGWEATVLDGGQAGTVVAAEQRAVVEGLTLACGEAEYRGGGVLLYFGTLRDARVTGNHAVWACGGIDAYESVVGPGVIVDANAADGYGGGLCGDQTSILDTTISANLAARGAGFHIQDRGEMRDVTVRGNTATEAGGGGYVECTHYRWTEVNLSGVTFEANAAPMGGGLAAQKTAYGYSPLCLTIADSVFERNSADLGGGYADTRTTGYYGAVLVRSRFSGNTAQAGGGIYGQTVYGYDLTFTDNVATEMGGALYNWGYGYLADVTMYRNEAPLGGALAFVGSPSGILQLYGDLGTGSDDNSDDVALLVTGETYSDYGDDVVVGCTRDPAGCAVAPPPDDTSEPVDTGGTDTGPPAPDTGDTGTAPSDHPGCDGATAALVDTIGYPTVADAVTAAPPGASVEICPGDWPANLVLATDVTLRGLEGAEATALDGGGTGTVVVVETGAGVILDALTIHGGYAELDGVGAESGAGIVVRGALTATDVEVRDNTSRACGGGLLVDGGEVVWQGGVFADNRAWTGGGACVSRGSLEVHDATFSANRAGVNGGGLYTSNPVTLDAVTFDANEAWAGGGAYVTGSGASHADGVTFTDNRGGGLYWSNSGTVSNLTATGNRGAFGGAVTLDYGTLDGCEMRGNQALEGGGLTVAYGSVTNCRVDGNTAVSGGGAWVTYDNGDLRECDLTENRAVWGGGAFIHAGDPVFDTCTLTGNEAAAGGGAWLERGTLTSTASDWGDGADDNAPDDVANALFSTAAYGADATFTCDATTGVCD